MNYELKLKLSYCLINLNLTLAAALTLLVDRVFGDWMSSLHASHGVNCLVTVYQCRDVKELTIS